MVFIPLLNHKPGPFGKHFLHVSLQSHFQDGFCLFSEWRSDYNDFMDKKLFIIGNGFDLHHGIPSSYKNFGIFLKNSDLHTFKVIEQYFDINDSFWSAFETRLADFDVDKLIDEVSVFLVGYADDDWSDSYHHDYQYEIDQTTSAISEKMREYFVAWVRQLPIPTTQTYSGLLINVDDKQSLFLNFNYTPTLQFLYGIPKEKVLHIHGMSSNETEDIILGHGWKPEESLDAYRVYSDPEDADMRVVEGQSIIDDYFKKTFKPVDQIIKNNELFFSSISAVKEIFVLGHSLSDVDLPYFKEIKCRISLDAIWNVSYHTDGEDKRMKDRLTSLGIPEEKISFFKL